MKAVAYVLCHFGETVCLAKLDKALRRELRRRADYAMRYQVHSPSQWRALRYPSGILLGLMAGAICLWV